MWSLSIFFLFDNTFFIILYILSIAVDNEMYSVYSVYSLFRIRLFVLLSGLLIIVRCIVDTNVFFFECF